MAYVVEHEGLDITMLTVRWLWRRLPRGASGSEGTAILLRLLACGIRGIFTWDRCCLSTLLLLLHAIGITRTWWRCVPAC